VILIREIQVTDSQPRALLNIWCIDRERFLVRFSETPTHFFRHFAWWPRFRRVSFEVVSVCSLAIRHLWLLQSCSSLSGRVLEPRKEEKFGRLFRDKARPVFIVALLFIAR
jgi:hypothetical protein